MNNNEKKKVKGAAFGLGGTWFGLLCGAGFATGAQGVYHFAKYGAFTIITPIITVALMALYAYVNWDLSRVYKVYTYREVYNKIFEPYDKIFGTICEIIYLVMVVMAMGAIFASAAQLFTNLFGTPYILGAIIISVLMFVLTRTGASFFFKASSILSIVLIISLLVSDFVIIALNRGKIVEVLSNWQSDFSFTQALMSALIYGSYQCIVQIGTVSVSDVLTTEREAKAAAIWGFILNGAMILFLSIAMLGLLPGATGQALPIVSYLQELGNPLLILTYNLGFFLSLLTSGISAIYGLVKRFEKYGTNIIPNDNTRRTVYSLLIIVVCFVISLVGLLQIISKGYAAMGYISIPLIYFPTVIIGLIKIKKNKQVNKVNSKVVLQNN